MADLFEEYRLGPGWDEMFSELGMPWESYEALHATLQPLSRVWRSPSPACADRSRVGRILSTTSYDRRMAKQTYHHGDLRQALMSAAARAIEESGPGALSLRDLARRAGVSHAAPAHHFGDKAGLLTALAAEGYGLLAAELAATRAATGSFLELGVTYVRFAVTHRAHFEVMFRRDLHRPDDPELAAARERAGDMLYAGAGQEASRGDGRFGEDGRLGGDGRLGEDEAAADSVRAAGVAAWSLAHGFATLWLNGSLSDLGADLDEAARTVLRRLRPGHDAS